MENQNSGIYIYTLEAGVPMEPVEYKKGEFVMDMENYTVSTAEGFENKNLKSVTTWAKTRTVVILTRTFGSLLESFSTSSTLMGSFRSLIFRWNTRRSGTRETATGSALSKTPLRSAHTRCSARFEVLPTLLLIASAAGWL